MRIAILTSARTGSTSLFYFIKNHLPKTYTSIPEPFNNDWRTYYSFNKYDVTFFENQSNLLIKTFVSTDQIPLEFTDNYKDYWEWFMGYFDKIILLDRKDKNLQSESLAYLVNKKDFYSWQKKQFYDLNIITKEQIEDVKLRLENESKFIHSFTTKYPIYYFEDIYIKKDKKVIKSILDYLGLEMDDLIYNMFIESDNQRIRLTEDESKIKKII